MVNNEQIILETKIERRLSGVPDALSLSPSGSLEGSYQDSMTRSFIENYLKGTVILSKYKPAFSRSLGLASHPGMD